MLKEDYDINIIGRQDYTGLDEAPIFHIQNVEMFHVEHLTMGVF